MSDAAKVVAVLVLWAAGWWFMNSIAPVPDPWAFIIAVAWFFGPVWIVSKLDESSATSGGARRFDPSYSGYPKNWSDIRKEVLARDGYQCGNCGRESDLDVHHIVPLSRGGSNRISNLRTLCRRCHSLLHPHMRN